MASDEYYSGNPRIPTAVFITLDGVDGVGKSTQLGMLVEWLGTLGLRVVRCRDPGSTVVGERIRSLLLDPTDMSLAPRGEMLLYMAARAQLVDEVIRPTLARGDTILSDRYLLANVVYQGHAGGLDVESLWQIGEVATAGVHPDLTLLLDMPVAETLARRHRTPDRMEARGLEYLERVRRGFLIEAARRPEIVVIDAARDATTVHDEIRQQIESRLLSNGKW